MRRYALFRTASSYSAVPILAVAVLAAPTVGESPPVPRETPEPSTCASVTPIRIEMTPTRRAGAARAVYEMRFSSSTFGVTVSEAGHYLYDVDVAVTGLPERKDAVFVVWVATSDLEEWVSLGPITNGQPIAGRVGWNKFIVFVTAESSAEVESWSQEFYFSALSPSSRMHTMVGHGPFSAEPCLDPRN
ncbi:MAG: hypothetical protein P8Y15_04960 [Gemmatimonadales bacterium]